jgi:putative NIF3 family GTP cyclohydrolase 1 type 2
LPGHYASERIGIEVLAENLKTQWPAIHAWASRDERDPIVMV